MLRISIHESGEEIGVALAGRLAGPWVGELDQAWKNIAPAVAGRKLSLDLRDLTYSDPQGMKLLKAIFKATQADLLTSSFWSQYLASEIRNTNGVYGKGREVDHGNNA